MTDREQAEALRVSVVIPTHNRWQQLRRVLEAHAAQITADLGAEVIVCDDASTDETPAEMAAYAASATYPLRYERQEKKGPAAARNRGIEVARGAIIVFTDDDCLPGPDFLTHHLARTRPGVATIGRLVWHPELTITPFMDALCPGWMFDYEMIDDPEDAPFQCFYTANVSATRADLLAVGGFDEQFPAAAYEDIELGYRLKQAGVRLVYDHDAMIYHLHAMEFGPTLRRQLINGRSMAYAVQKHPELAVDAGFPGLRDPDLPRRFYHAALDYYLMGGLQQGVEEQYGERWADTVEEVLKRNPRFTPGIEHEFAAARRYAGRLERRVAELERAQERQEAVNRQLDAALRRANPIKRRLRALLSRRARADASADRAE